MVGGFGHTETALHICHTIMGKHNT
ncbi:hypothetical protein VCHA43P273_30326 [Vibrio chagasii]|nr:hypothetical protein VCHA37O173_20565 [Vibrio chagasii]CAH6995805.1 hypothetical protein VCHA35P150_40215 [Vibrio chagasii]CAH7284188.1 hypothetical protein VCHA43P273_30326 [Vibrio chagasii]CAH7324725.1 hypothetical protein VCHA56P515_40219 [Vibrio chagasii]CAH7336814.1 hypothetical protein VCHA37P191_40212 [Vibrio chagasii]